MATKKIKACTACKKPRKILVKGSILTQRKDFEMNMTTTLLCVPCFLEAVGMGSGLNPAHAEEFLGRMEEEVEP